MEFSGGKSEEGLSAGKGSDAPCVLERETELHGKRKISATGKKESEEAVSLKKSS